MFNPELLGERILILRRRHNWTQRDLAKEAGVSHITVARVERGKMKQVSVDIVMRMAGVLDASVDYLLGLKDKNEMGGTPQGV